jgi:hypothetical protein
MECNQVPNTSLFEVVVIQRVSEDERKTGQKERVLTEARVLARDRDTAVIQALTVSPLPVDANHESLEVLVRPF